MGSSAVEAASAIKCSFSNYKPPIKTQSSGFWRFNCRENYKWDGGELSADRSGDWALMSKKSGLTREQTRAEEYNLGSIRQIVSEFTEFEKGRTRLGKN